MPIEYLDQGSTKNSKFTYLDEEPSSSEPVGLDKIAAWDQSHILQPMASVSKYISPDPNVNPVLSQLPSGGISQGTSPQESLGSLPGYLSKGASKIGEWTAQQMARQGANPYLAAGVGTAMGMAPDVAMSVGNPESEGSAMFDKSANEYALRSLGFTKRFLKNYPMATQAKEAAQTLLDQGVIKGTRSIEGMADANAALAQQSGKAIGDYLQSLEEKGKFFDPQQATEEISALRPKAGGQVLRGGLYDAINAKIDNALATIQAHGSTQQLLDASGNPIQMQATPLGWQEANQLKGTLQGAANYASNKEATLLDKAIAGKFRESLDSQMEDFANKNGDLEGIKNFKQNKKIYAATQIAEDPIYNRLSSLAGNNKLSLTDWIVLAPGLFTGHALPEIGAIAAKHIGTAYGPQLMATGLRSAGLATQSPVVGGGAAALSTLGLNQEQNSQ